MTASPRPTESRILVETFAALANETRLDLCRLLARHRPGSLSAGALARLLATPQNTLSTHLAILERAGLVAGRREGRRILYRLLPDGLAGLEALIAECAAVPVPARSASGRKSPFSVLFLCTANSARSIMAEAILRRDGGDRVSVFSAGSRPRGAVHPQALDLLANLGYPTDSLASTSWTAFAGPRAPRLDLVVTVCDAAAGEACPAFLGEPISVHWGVADPIAGDLAPEERRAAVRRAYRLLAARVSAFLALPFETMDPVDLADALAAIGRMDGATPFTLSRAA